MLSLNMNSLIFILIEKWYEKKEDWTKLNELLSPKMSQHKIQMDQTIMNQMVDQCYTSTWLLSKGTKLG